MKLSIDTTDNLQTKIVLDSEVFVKHYENPRQQDVLGAINQALEEKDITFETLTEIEVNTGPGSFTGIRVGIAVAQALSLSLDLPVNGIEAPAIIQPFYGKSPGITKK